MRHRKNTVKLNRNSSHRRCMFANLLKSLVTHGRVETTLAKAAALSARADRLVTLSKQGTLASKRKMLAELMIRFNPLSAKQRRAVKNGDMSACNIDRMVVSKLFGEFPLLFAARKGGYTRIIRKNVRRGDGAAIGLIEYLQ